MAFSLSEWWMRQKVGAQVRGAGRHVEHHRVGNPYHAVSIEAGMRCCEAAREAEGTRFLSASAPMLPLDGCTQARCLCRYTHHNDRRARRDRRVQFPNAHALRNGERRASSGRRLTD